MATEANNCRAAHYILPTDPKRIIYNKKNSLHLLKELIKHCVGDGLFLNLMSLKIASLNSGSNGNCYYIGNNDDAVLIDAGISCRETERRLKLLGIAISSIRAIIVSHEHSDHISGIEVLHKKHGIPVYITAKTLRNSRLRLQEEAVRFFNSNDGFAIGNLFIQSFGKHHDACEPNSFTVSCGNKTIGIFTDIGRVCTQLSSHFRRCDAVFLESNFDEEMLETGRYPFHLKKRIRGGNGHLSNTEALELFKTHQSPQLRLLILSHLSHNNNCPQLVANLFEKHAAPHTQVVVASRFCATQLFTVSEPTTNVQPALQTALQLAMFD